MCEGYDSATWLHTIIREKDFECFLFYFVGGEGGVIFIFA